MWYIIASLVLWNIPFSSFVLSQENGYFVTLEHSFDGEKFFQLGEIHFSSLKGEHATIQVPTLSERNKKLMEPATKNSEIYKIRVWSQLQGISIKTSNNRGFWITSFAYVEDIKSCSSDVITLHTDGLGNIISVNIRSCVENNLANMNDVELQTVLMVKTPSQAPIPDIHGYLNKMEEEKRKREISDKEPTSFFGRYWMYIVPVVVFMMISNTMQQQQG